MPCGPQYKWKGSQAGKHTGRQMEGQVWETYHRGEVLSLQLEEKEGGLTERENTKPPEMNDQKETCTPENGNVEGTGDSGQWSEYHHIWCFLCSLMQMNYLIYMKKSICTSVHCADWMLLIMSLWPSQARSRIQGETRVRKQLYPTWKQFCAKQCVWQNV